MGGVLPTGYGKGEGGAFPVGSWGAGFLVRKGKG